MLLSGKPSNIVVGNIFSGFYTLNVAGGIDPHVFEFSSQNYPILNFSSPYDAKLVINTGDDFNSLIAVGRRIDDPSNYVFQSDIIGELYYSDSKEIFGACHGYHNDNLTYYNGYNFYNAIYPIGYFSPPFGDNISILKFGDSNTSTLTLGVCSPLNLTEYNEIFGINSIAASDSNISASDLIPNSFTTLSSPKAVCPEDAVGFFFEEVGINPIQGTTAQLGANNLFNSNPIPTSLDNYEIRLSSRYSIFTSGDTDNQQNYLTIKDGRPVPSYSTTSQQNKLNNNLCFAEIVETETDFGKGTNGIQLIIAPDEEQGAVGDQTSFIGVNDPWNLWHFNYKENSETFPFLNNFTEVPNDEPVHSLGGSEGTQLFDSTLAIPDYYWQYRQCPNTVNYLPYNFGGAIYACPSYYFDIPYYAAINKFGFYGTRFFNSCAGLQLDYPLSGVKNAIEVDSSGQSFISLGNQLEPMGIDTQGGGDFAQYDNLLSIAQSEQSFSQMYALNKAFFFWANNQFVEQTPQFQQLSNNYPSFITLYSGMIYPLNQIYSGDFSGFENNPPSVIQSSTQNIIVPEYKSEVLLTNNLYNEFFNQLNKIITGTDTIIWMQIEKLYGYYVSNGNGAVNETFYQNLITGRDARIATRYYQNIVHGNPIDLFPLNSVTFSYDKAQDYLESTGWNRLTTTFGENSLLPQINREYFAGAYTNGEDINGFLNVINSLSLNPNSYYYPGFFNDISVNKTFQSPTYGSIASGIILDSNNRSFSPSGWLALGAGELGTLDKNFSCFTPIFTQNPIDTFCKIGQAPTFRCQAVDYHSIPDDKISTRYSEILYWAYKLKMLDNNFNNLYPLQYLWYRVKITDYDNFIQRGDFSLLQMGSATGDWACMEGQGTNNCTLINPKLCFPPYTGGSTNSSNYTFINGASYGIDDNYKYICVASGRFGIRISEPAQLNIENWLRFDVSFKNGMNTQGTLGMQFNIIDYLGNKKSITMPSVAAASYNGYQRDEFAIVEAQATQKIPPPNAGYGDVSALAPVGPIKYIGALRSYSPSYLEDTRGLQETWGKFLDYGSLIPFYKTLSQQEGNLLYGYGHLPVCTNYQMNNGQAGIQIYPTVNGNQVLHWSLSQRAVASYQNTWIGVPVTQLNNFGALYPPITPQDYLKGVDYETMGVGHWQWYNNFGAIKRFGQLSTPTSNDIVYIGNGAPASNDTAAQNAHLILIKKLLISPTSLAGTNCGYTPFGLGRNMIFYIEAFDRFYIYCDPLKKKNVQDLTYMNPGIRQGNSAIQYFWLGQPNNTYLERRPMYGPYAYQWRVRRHNRDRNGNGISKGFYSMGWEQAYSEMYDAPAIYGLYPKITDNPSSISAVQNILNLRQTLGFLTDVQLRGNWFGTTNGEGTATNYGNVMVDTSVDSPLSEYYSSFSSLAGEPDFSNYGCTEDNVRNGRCFDPCISIRYGQGFFPGGKSQNLFGAGKPNTNTKLVAMANNIQNGIILNDEQSTQDDTVYFRSPVNTPYSVIMRGLGNKIAGISPCKDGGSDHCNYITPTVHIGTTSYLQGLTSSFLSQVNLIESFVRDL